MSKPQQVILYSTTLHTWEVWANCRSLGHGTLEACQFVFPNAIGPTLYQVRRADADRAANKEAS